MPPPPADSDESVAKKFGVVLFDDEKDPTTAWAAVNGAEAQRIEGIHQLGTDTLWWSNITYESFFRSTESWRNPWLRHDGYLVVKQKDVLQEWGLDPATTPPNYTAEFCSTIFQRIMQIAYRLIRQVDPKSRMSTMFTGTTLREDLRRLLPPAEYPQAEAASVLRSGMAFAEFTRTTVRGVKGAKIFVLRRPRVSYAYEMLNTPLPKGPFEFVPRSTLRQITKDRVKWVQDETRPCMVEIAVQQMEPDVAPVYGFGNSTDKDKRIPRSWVAHPEFIVMSGFSEIEVKSAWVGKQYSLITNELPKPIQDFLSDKFTELSWSAGVIAETIWRAAALSEEKGRGPNIAPEDRAHTSWRGAWLKAADKTAMFMHAMKLTELGYAAVSYGLGWVSCLATEDQIPDLIRDALTVGLVPKLVDVPDNLFDPSGTIPWGGEKQAFMPTKMTMTKDKNMLWNFDKLPLFDDAQREAMVRKMAAARSTRKM